MNLKLYVISIITLLVLIISCNKNNSLPIDNEKAEFSNWWKNKIIYEVNLRQFTEEGSFKSFEKHLPRLKELGVDILWFMPIHPIGIKNRKCSLGSYYSVRDYLAVNPEFGTIEEFKSLVTRIHEMEMFVIIDWVANHCAWDNQLVVEHPDWFTKDIKGNFIPPVDDWTDVVDFNYDNKELREYMINALKYWVKEADIDGYRCDVAEMVPLDFWKTAREELEKIKHVFMLAEAGSPECHKNGFDATYGWDIFHMMNDIATNKKNAADLSKLLKHEIKLLSKGVYRMNFTSNHDENSWSGTVFERLGKGSEAFAVLSFVIPGMPLIYNGQESGLDKRLSFFEKDLIEWKNNQYTQLYTTLIKFYRENITLIAEGEKDNFEFIKTTDNKNVLSFLRANDSNKVLAIFNLSPNTSSFIIKNFKHKDTFKSSLPNDKSELSINKEIHLKPWEYKIFIN